MPRIEETLGQDGCYQKGRKESLVRSQPSEESKFVGEELDFLPGSFSRSMYFPKNHWTLEWRGLHLAGGRVLKIATFEGSGFLGLHFSTNVKTFLGQG